MLCTIFVLRPDGLSWQHRGDIEAPNVDAAKYLAIKTFKAIDGSEKVWASGPGEPFPVGPAPSGKLKGEQVALSSQELEAYRKVAESKPKAPAAKKAFRLIEDDFTWPKRRPLGRFRREDARRALEQDDETLEYLSELFEPITNLTPGSTRQ